MSALLDGIDAPPWASFEHAYGTAEDVPGLLERVADGDKKALGELCAAVNHQGWPSHAAATACVPFLWAIVRGGVLRAEVMCALGELGAGGQHEHFLGTGIVPDAPPYFTVCGEGAALRAAVRAGADAAVALLGDKDAKVRGAAAFVCATAGAVEALPALLAALKKEKAAAAACDELVAVGWLGAGSSDAMAAIERRLADKNVVVRTHAAIALAALERLSDEARAVLVSALADPKPQKLSWASGRVATHALAALLATAKDDAALAELLRAAPEKEAGTVAATLLARVFQARLKAAPSDPKDAPPLAPGTLTTEERGVLRAFRAVPVVFSDSDFDFRLRRLGIPYRSASGVARWMGEAPSVLDRAVTLGGRTVTIEAAWRHGCNDGSPTEAAEAIARALEGEPAELVDASWLGHQLPSLGGDGWKHAELFLCLYDHAGPAVVPALREALLRVQRDGTPKEYANGMQLTHVFLPMSLAAALVALSDHPDDAALAAPWLPKDDFFPSMKERAQRISGYTYSARFDGFVARFAARAVPAT